MSDESLRVSAGNALGPLEHEVMLAVWSQGEATVRTVRDALNRAVDSDRAYTTVMTTMHRLAGKGLLRRRRHGLADVYTATCTKDAYREARAAAEVRAVIARFGDAALVAYVRAAEGRSPTSHRGPVRFRTQAPRGSAGRLDGHGAEQDTRSKAALRGGRSRQGA